MARWQRLDLSTSYGHPPVGQLCVLRTRRTVITREARTEYQVGRFVRDPNSDSPRKLWWLRGDVLTLLENPAHWRSRYDEILYVEVSAEEDGDRHA